MGRLAGDGGIRFFGNTTTTPELGLIDEYEFIVHPRLVGHGPTLFAGLSQPVDLQRVSRAELGSGAVVLRYGKEG